MHANLFLDDCFNIFNGLKVRLTRQRIRNLFSAMCHLFAEHGFGFAHHHSSGSGLDGDTRKDDVWVIGLWVVLVCVFIENIFLMDSNS
jgi:hypothetical protein